MYSGKFEQNLNRKEKISQPGNAIKIVTIEISLRHYVFALKYIIIQIFRFHIHLKRSDFINILIKFVIHIKIDRL